MPPVNPVIVSAGFIAISVAVVAAIAVYENPEVRRMADDLRRRIAVAVQSINDTVNGENLSEDERRRQQEGEPIFNRPEDAEGFMMSQGRRTADDPGVVADEESRRRQREELMYWNRMQMERKKEEERRARETRESTAGSSSASSALESLQRATRDAAAAAGIHLSSFGGPQSQPRSKTSFDQFMRPDHNADRGTFVVNTGADAMTNSHVSEDPLNSGLLRRRRPEGVRGLHTAAVYANPFGDEYGIEMDDHTEENHYTAPTSRTGSSHGPTAAEAYNSGTAYLIAPDRDETMSDIYSATEPDTNNANNNNNNSMDAVFDPLPSIPETRQQSTSEVFFDVNDYAHETGMEASPATLAAVEVDSQLSLRLFRKSGDNEDDEDDNVVLPSKPQSPEQDQVNTEAYNSIQAWAQNTSSLPGFYSPLPVTPSVGMSEPSVINGGDMTPTGSMSVWGDDHSVIDHNDAKSEADARTDAGSEIVQVQAQVSAAPSVPSTTPSSGMSVTDAVEVAEAANSDYGVISEADDHDDESDGIMTPTSWSEVGSVVSESDAGMHAMHA